MVLCCILNILRDTLLFLVVRSVREGMPGFESYLGSRFFAFSYFMQFIACDVEKSHFNLFCVKERSKLYRDLYRYY